MWKTIQAEPEYEVSNTGDVRNRKTNHVKSIRLDRYGYKRVTLYPSGKTYSIHRLVALAFIDNPNKLKTVNHINGNKFDNSVANLEWLSFSDNSKHAHRTGLVNLDVKGTKNPMSKFTEEDIKEIRVLNSLGNSTTEIANQLSFPYERVRRLLKGDSYNN